MSIQCVTGSSRFGFHAGPVDNWRDIMYFHPEFGFSESYKYQGGELLIGSVPVEDEYSKELNPPGVVDAVWLAYWQGAAHSLAAISRVTGDVRPDFFDWFERFDISETPEGIAIAPRAASDVQLVGSEVVKEIPSLDLLTVHDRRQASELVPAYEGTSVAGGELFVVDLDGEEGLPAFFVLVGDTAVTTIQPIRGEMDDPSRLSVLEKLIVTWQ
jgi:hypothetical protein